MQIQRREGAIVAGSIVPRRRKRMKEPAAVGQGHWRQRRGLLLVEDVAAVVAVPVVVEGVVIVVVVFCDLSVH